MESPACRRDRKYTYADYLKWPENERWEIIAGVAYNMTPAPSRMHQKILRELLTTIHNYLRGKTCEVYAAPFDVRLPEDTEEGDNISNVVQPDIVVVCDPGKLDERGCKGAPDLIIEILSPATAAKDLIKKRALYERHGVREYWLVDPTNKTVLVYILQTESGTRKYGAPQAYALDEEMKDAEIKVHILDELSISLCTIFA